MENLAESRSNELSSEEVKPVTETEFFIEIVKEQSVSTDKADEFAIPVSDQGSFSTDKAAEVLIQASDQGSVSGVEEQNMYVVNISGQQHGEKLENVAIDSFSDIDISSEQEQEKPKRRKIRRLFNFKSQKKNPEELKESSSVQGRADPVNDEKRAHSSPSPWPKIVNRAGLTFERLRAGTPDSVISVLQRFRPKSSRGLSPERVHDLPPRSPDLSLRREVASPTLRRLGALRKRLNTMGRQAGTRIERFQGGSLPSPGEDQKKNEGDGAKPQDDIRQSRMERWRADLQRPPNWLREHFLRRCKVFVKDLHRQNRDQDAPQEATSSNSSHLLSLSHGRRQQEKELEMVEQSMKMDEILRLPMITYKPKADKSSEICVVCTEEFKRGETLRVLTCFHTFHQGCIDEWLLNYCPWDNLICPICKTMQYSFLESDCGKSDSK